MVIAGFGRRGALQTTVNEGFHGHQPRAPDAGRGRTPDRARPCAAVTGPAMSADGGRCYRRPVALGARLRRFLFRVPLRLRRWGIGGFERLLGVDWIVLTTRGRRTGRPHDVMLDVVGHDPAADTFFVQPADGRRADWVRNVTADARVLAEIHGRRFDARVVDVTGPEGAEVVLRFVRSHPWYARIVVWLVGYVDRLDVPDAVLRARLATTPVFAIRPEAASRG
jgi:deazaflavin-dependent oxidoreductase (nitroreductase family)